MRGGLLRPIHHRSKAHRVLPATGPLACLRPSSDPSISLPSPRGCWGHLHLFSLGLLTDGRLSLSVMECFTAAPSLLSPLTVFAPGLAYLQGRACRLRSQGELITSRPHPSLTWVHASAPANVYHRVHPGDRSPIPQLCLSTRCACP